MLMVQLRACNSTARTSSGMKQQAMQYLPLGIKERAAHTCACPAPYQPLNSYVMQHDAAHVLLRWCFEPEGQHRPLANQAAEFKLRLYQPHTVWWADPTRYQCCHLSEAQPILPCTCLPIPEPSLHSCLAMHWDGAGGLVGICVVWMQ